MLVIAPGTQFQIRAHGTGTFNPVPHCIGIESTGWTRDTTEVTGRLDGAKVYVPGLFDPGKLNARFMLDDTAPASNMHTAFRTHLIDKGLFDVRINLPGSWDEAAPPMFQYTGWVSHVSGLDVNAQSGVLEYSVEFTLVIMDK